MNHVDLELKWKSVNPRDTINKINNILYDNNINIDMNWTGYFPDIDVYSNKIDIHNKSFGTCGKGSSPILAEASGKAELMERIQFGMSCYQRTPNTKFFDDEIIINNSLNIPFLNLKNFKTEYLDNNNNMLKSSVGLAAGNTIEEATVHAICEILEHYTLYLFVNNKIKINFEYNIQNEKIYYLQKTIPNCKSINFYNVSIGKIPIVLMFILLENNWCAVKIDCAQTHEIAIHRVINEFLQGRDLEYNEAFSPIIDYNINPVVMYSLMSVSSRHQWYSKNNIKNIFTQEKKLKDLNDLNDFNTELECINSFFKEESKIFIKDIFIRDYSFLGFPTIKFIVNPNREDIFKYDPKYLLKASIISHELLYKTHNEYFEKKCHENIQNNLIKIKDMVSFENKFGKYQNFYSDINKFDFLKSIL